jgi:hypothetical protein
MENNVHVVKTILPTLIEFIKNPFNKYSIKEHASIVGAISNLTDKNINYSFVNNTEGNIFLREVYQIILQYMRYLTVNIHDTILTLNYIFAFPIRENVISNFDICNEIYEKRYVTYQKYKLLNSMICKDITNHIILIIYNN